MADLRSVGKPSTFSGDEEMWNEWSFSVKAYLIMAGVITVKDLDFCGNAKQMILDCSFGRGECCRRKHLLFSGTSDEGPSADDSANSRGWKRLRSVEAAERALREA